MVSDRRGATRGASALGCLFSILIVAVVFYYGIDIGRAYWKYYRLTDEMETSARFAHGQTDEQIIRHLASVTHDLELPPEAAHFTIRRSDSPPLVSIRTTYHVIIQLPFQHRTLTLQPHTEVRQ